MSKAQKIFLKRVEELMEGKTAYWLSKESGLSEGTLSRILSGKMKPALDSIEAIANGFNVTVCDLFAEEEPDIPPDIVRMLKDQDKVVYDSIRAMLKALNSNKR